MARQFLIAVAIAIVLLVAALEAIQRQQRWWINHFDESELDTWRFLHVRNHAKPGECYQSSLNRWIVAGPGTQCSSIDNTGLVWTERQGDFEIQTRMK